MSDVEPIWIILTTYNRQDCAIKTIQGVKTYLQWPNIGWIITDDGTGGDHLQTLRKEVGDSYQVHTYDGQRKGVSHNMNWAINKVKALGGKLLMILEDDWELVAPFDPTPHVNLLMNHTDIGMVRLGYLSVNLMLHLISRENHLWGDIINNGETYRYAGHASLRHMRLHEEVSMFREGLKPGENELDFCGKYNKHSNPPKIVWDMDYGRISAFHHIGSVSLADTPVGS